MTNEKQTTELVKVKPLVNYELSSARQIEELTVDMAKADIWRNAPIEDVRKAVHIAKARGANPWCNEIYLIPRKSEGVMRWVIQMSQNYVIKVATSHPDCAGWQDGVIVQGKDGNLQQLEGAFVPPGWTLVGAWWKGYRKGWQIPMVKRVNLSEYSTGRSTWAKLPSTMIIKVARTQGLREMLPDRLSGMYDSAEMDQMGDQIIMKEGTPPPALPATSAPPANNQPKNAPATTDKDGAHLQELIGIVMTAGNGEEVQAKEILKKLSSFKGKKGGQEVDIFLESFRDPRLKGKWLNKVLAKAREENPEIAADVQAKLKADAEAKEAEETAEPPAQPTGREPGEDDDLDDNMPADDMEREV